MNNIEVQWHVNSLIKNFRWIIHWKFMVHNHLFLELDKYLKSTARTLSLLEHGAGYSFLTFGVLVIFMDRVFSQGRLVSCTFPVYWGHCLKHGHLEVSAHFAHSRSTSSGLLRLQCSALSSWGQLFTSRKSWIGMSPLCLGKLHIKL